MVELDTVKKQIRVFNAKKLNAALEKLESIENQLNENLTVEQFFEIRNQYNAQLVKVKSIEQAIYLEKNPNNEFHKSLTFNEL